jgi:hypothetical protein
MEKKMSNIDTAQQTSVLIEDLEDIISSINKNFLLSAQLDEFSLSDDFISDLLEKLENAHTELVNAVY